jgi:ribonuclease E
MATNDNTSDTTSDITSAGDDATRFPADHDPETTPAPRRRATRRTTKKAAATAEPKPDAGTEPAATAEVETTTTAAPNAAPTEAPTEAPAAEPATEPAKRAARKRAPRKKAEPADVAAKPAKRGSRSKADRAAAALEELVAEVKYGDDATVAEAADTPGDAMTHVTLDEAADESVDVAPDADLVDVEAMVDVDETSDGDLEQPLEQSDARPAAVVPSFSVLFQAPDATQAVPTRRRRVAAPAAPAAEEPAHEPEEEPTAEVDEESGPTEDQPEEETAPRRSRRRRGGKGRRGRPSDDDESQDQPSEAAGDTEDTGEASEGDEGDEGDQEPEEEAGTSRRRRRRRRAGSSADSGDDSPNVSTRVRQPRTQSDEPVAVKGSTRLEAKKQRRREGREAGRRRTIITEAEFLARREAVDRVMVVRNKDGRTQMGVLEDGVLVEHYIDQATNVSMAGNIYLGRVQNVLPSMEAAFVDIGKGRNAVLYAGEVNWDAAGLETNQPKRIENALSSGQTVLVQVTKDPIGHKGARLTSQISLPGRYLVYVPNSSMTGISRKLPDTERARLKKILREVVPDSAGVIVRTAAEGASEDELRADVERLTRTWEDIQAKAEAASTPRAGKSKGKKKNGAAGSATGAQAPMLLHGEPDLTVRVIRDVFNEDFKQLVVAGDQAWNEIHPYISSVAPDLADRVTKWTAEEDLFSHHRVDEQLAKAMDRKVWLPSGGSLVIDRTEAMTVVDVNTGKFVGSGGNLEETVTKNNIEAAEEIVRQLRLRDIGGIIVIDFIDMVLESNRDLVVRRLLECLGRDRTKHQVAEVTSLGLVQMTRKRVGSGLIEVFSETCDHCNGRGFIIHADPVDRGANQHEPSQADTAGSSRRRGRGGSQGGSGNQAGQQSGQPSSGGTPAEPKHNGPTAAQIAAAAHAAALKSASGQPAGEAAAEAVAEVQASGAAPDGVSAGETHELQELQESRESRREQSFPQDEGPWAGDDAHEADSGAEAQGTEGGGHVELESDVTSATDSEATDSEATDGERAAGSADEGADVGADEAAEAGAEAGVAEATPTEPEVTVESQGPEPVEAAVELQPAARGRRRRGRVVAPAGPPRGSAGSGQ